MLTLETKTGGEMVALYGDPEGLRKLATCLLSLIDRTKDGYFEHIHLMSSDWGGSELTAERQSDEGTVVHHLKIICFKGDKFQK